MQSPAHRSMHASMDPSGVEVDLIAPHKHFLVAATPECCIIDWLVYHPSQVISFESLARQQVSGFYQQVKDIVG